MRTTMAKPLMVMARNRAPTASPSRRLTFATTIAKHAAIKPSKMKPYIVAASLSAKPLA
jgi:hypothetical protein